MGGRPSQHSTKNSPAWIGLTLSLKRDGCEVVAVSPFRIFPRAVLAFFPRVAIRSIYQHFVTNILSPPPVLRGKEWQQKFKKNVVIFIFIFLFSFCQNNDYVTEIPET